MGIGGTWCTPVAAALAAAALVGAGAAPWLAMVAAALAAAAAARGARRASERAAAAGRDLAALERSPGCRDHDLTRTAHELRAPIGCVEAALELLRNSPAPSIGEARDCLEEAAVAARHMAVVVDDVLDEAALARGELRLAIRAHRLADVVDQALWALGGQAARRGVMLRAAAVDHGLAVRADRRRLLQVLFRLVGNAVQAAAAGDCIEVRVEPQASRLRLLVADDGPPVPPSGRVGLFARPPGAAGTDRARPGRPTAGLHVCSRLLQQMGGRIGYEPAPGGGSVFWCELPRASLRQPIETTIAEAAGAAR